MSIPSSGLPGLPGSAPALPQGMQGMDPNDPNAKMVSSLEHCYGYEARQAGRKAGLTNIRYKTCRN